MSITIIGDVHQKYDRYFKLTEKHNYTVQIGDMGFDYKSLFSLDQTKHIWFAGNHDNRDIVVPANNLGKFGQATLNGISFFFISGAWSIDGEWRRKNEFRLGKTWWPDEELSYSELESAINEYQNVKPSTVLTHECPLSIVQYVTNPEFTKEFGYTDRVIKTRTNQALQRCFELHQPTLWIFGHYHKSWSQEINGTKFICLNELETYEIS